MSRLPQAQRADTSLSVQDSAAASSRSTTPSCSSLSDELYDPFFAEISQETDPKSPEPKSPTAAVSSPAAKPTEPRTVGATHSGPKSLGESFPLASRLLSNKHHAHPPPLYKKAQTPRRSAPQPPQSPQTDTPQTAPTAVTSPDQTTRSSDPRRDAPTKETPQGNTPTTCARSRKRRAGASPESLESSFGSSTRRTCTPSRRAIERLTTDFISAVETQARYEQSASEKEVASSNSSTPPSHTTAERSHEARNAEYEVEQILDQRTTKAGIQQYKIRWAGYAQDTWEPRENLSGTAESALSLFNAKQLKQQRSSPSASAAGSTDGHFSQPAAPPLSPSTRTPQESTVSTRHRLASKQHLHGEERPGVRQPPPAAHVHAPLDPLALYQPLIEIVKLRPTPHRLETLNHKHKFIAQLASFKSKTLLDLPAASNQAFIDTLKPALQVLAGAIRTNNDELTFRALAAIKVLPQFILRQHGKPTSVKARNAMIRGPLNGSPPTEAPVRALHEEEEVGFLSPEQRLAVRRSHKLLQAGDPKRALDALIHVGHAQKRPADPTDDVIKKLEDLHPKASEPPPPIPLLAPFGIPLSKRQFAKSARSLKKNVAPDLFGWTPALLNILMRDPTCADSIRLLSEQIIDGNLSDDVRDLVMVCWLIALDDTKKIRPIAGGCIEFVLSMHYLMGNNKDAVRQVIQKSGLQFGIGCREGVISSARITQLALEADPNKLVLKVDYAAAFQNTKRKQMLNMIFEQPRFAPLFRIIHFAYAKQSMLLVRDKMGIVQASISSEEGCRQGCVAGSLLFANTTLPALEAVQKEFPSLVMTAVLDDTTLIADENVIFAAYRRLRKLQRVNGCIVQKKKCEMLLTDKGLTPAVCVAGILYRFKFYRHNSALPLLGTAVGRNPSALESFAVNKVEAWHGALFLLAQKEVQAQDALLLLRCFPKKLNFQLRALPPDVTCLAADRLDENLLQSIQIRFNLPFESPFSLHTLHAPRNHGGLNIDKAVDLADQSFVSSMAASVPNIRMTRVWKTGRNSLTRLPQFQQCLQAIDRLPDAALETTGLKKGNIKDFVDAAARGSLPKNLASTISQTRSAALRDLQLTQGTPTEQAILLSRLNQCSASVFHHTPRRRSHICSCIGN